MDGRPFFFGMRASIQLCSTDFFPFFTVYLDGILKTAAALKGDTQYRS